MTTDRPPISQDGPDVLLAIDVQPRASRNQLIPVGTRTDGQGPSRIRMRLTAPPVEGAANEACRAFLAQFLGLPISRITITRGATAHNKLLRIRNADAASVLARLQSAK